MEYYHSDPNRYYQILMKEEFGIDIGGSESTRQPQNQNQNKKKPKKKARKGKIVVEKNKKTRGPLGNIEWSGFGGYTAPGEDDDDEWEGEGEVGSEVDGGDSAGVGKDDAGKDEVKDEELRDTEVEGAGGGDPSEGVGSSGIKRDVDADAESDDDDVKWSEASMHKDAVASLNDYLPKPYKLDKRNVSNRKRYNLLNGVLEAVRLINDVQYDTMKYEDAIYYSVDDGKKGVMNNADLLHRTKFLQDEYIRIRRLKDQRIEAERELSKKNFQEFTRKKKEEEEQKLKEKEREEQKTRRREEQKTRRRGRIEKDKEVKSRVNKDHSQVFR